MGIVFSGLFQLLFMAVFILILVIFVVTAVRSLRTWNQNNHSPRLTVNARVVAKRTQVSHHNSTNGTFNSSTRYFVTFEVESGDRMELVVSGSEYGMLVEGDWGRLSFQGTRYLGFERQ